MPKNWKTYKLEDALEVLIDYRGKTPKKTLSGIPLVTAKIVKRGAIQEPKEFIAIKDYDKWMVRGFPEIGDIVLTTEAPLGEVAIIKNNKIALAQRIVTLRGTVNILDSTYLKYFLQSSIGQNRLVARESGTTVTGIKQSELRKVLIECPPYKEQTQIANILSAIDDKIENNLAINKTLEDMAMAFYKHWFVDFGPFQEGEFIDSELGLIPKGWEVKIIGNVIDTLGGGTPKTTENSYWENGDILWYSPTDLTRDNAMFSLDSSKRINNLGLLKSSAKLFPPYSLLMSSRATIGALTINTIKASTNQGFITMIPNDNMSVYQLYSWTKWNMDLIISKSNGSTFKEISKANFRSLEIVVGQNIELFLRESKNIFDKVENNIQENQSLTKLRDTLLPKLISGEVRLKEFREGIDAEMNSA